MGARLTTLSRKIICYGNQFVLLAYEAAREAGLHGQIVVNDGVVEDGSKFIYLAQ